MTKAAKFSLIYWICAEGVFLYFTFYNLFHWPTFLSSALEPFWITIMSSVASILGVFFIWIAIGLARPFRHNRTAK